MKVLVTGGAGYIGSHTALRLYEKGHQVIICDDLSTGYEEAILNGELYKANVASKASEELFKKHKFDAVMHFAASCSVEESVADPNTYYENNTMVTLQLLQFCQKYGVKHFIFSSTAAVYGMPSVMPIKEDCQLAPINPYGNSKLACEMILNDLADTGALEYVALRYFNAAGADSEARIGQRRGNHLIKNVCRCANGELQKMHIYGNDYDTSDGTCVRDYIHVLDIADAHILALDYLVNGGQSVGLNCGYGKGYSVSEIIESAKKVIGIDFEVVVAQRRAGDPAMLIADNDKIKKVLNWQPQYNSLPTIIADAWRWECHIRSADKQTDE